MYCNSSPLTFRNNERTALEFYKIPQPPTETAYKKTVGWAAVLFTRPKRKRTPNGGFETTDFKTAALSVTAPYPAPCGAAAPAVPAASCRRLSVSLSAVSLAYSAFHAFTGRAVLPIITKARVGAQARYPCAPPPFRLPSAPPSFAGWAVLAAVSIKNTPAGFGRSEVDVLKFFDG